MAVANRPPSTQICSLPAVLSPAVFHSKNLIGCDEQPLPRIRKAHTRSMRGHRSKSLASLGVHHNTITRAGACNSLCSKTLPISLLAPRLYQGPAGVPWTQLVRFQYFAKTARKKIGLCRAFKRTDRFSRESVPTPLTASHYMLAYGMPVPVQSQRPSIP